MLGNEGAGDGRRLLELAVEASSNGIVLTDATREDNPIIYVNPAFERISGCSAEEALGRNCRFLRDPREEQPSLEGLRAAVKEGREWTGVLRNYKKDGTPFWNELHLAPVHDVNGRLTNYIGVQEDVTGRKELEEQLKHRAFHDGLTGLPNRALFTERLEHALERAGRKGELVAILFLDLDGFKDVNDTLGHDAGDGLLVAVADRLKEHARAGDTVARLGGDEFTVLLEDATAEDASLLAERMLEALGAPISLAGREVSVTASVGVALGDPTRARPQDLVREADNAMYRSKGRGRGLYEVHGVDGVTPLRLPSAPAHSGVGAVEEEGTRASGKDGGYAPPSRRRDARNAKPAPDGAGEAANGRAKGRQCSRCESLPEKLAGPGRLYLWLPLDHTLTKTYRHLRAEGWTVETARDYSAVIRLDDGRLTDLLSALSAVLSGEEMEDTRALFKPGGDDLTVSDIPRAQPLGQLSSLGASGWLLDMLSEGRLTSHFQPIVRVEDPEEVFAQECLLRGVDPKGGIVSPGRIFGAAKSTRMLFQTDLAARRTAIREAKHHGVEGNLFINFTPSAVYDPAFCLRSTVEAVEEAGIEPERIVFEVTETEETKDVDHLKNIADFYREKGFRVALDDVGSGYSSLNMVHRLRPDFIKLDMHLVRGVDSDPYKALVAGKVLEMARGLGVETIAEGVETEGELAWVRENGATFAQGYLIARPSSPPVVRPTRPS